MKKRLWVTLLKKTFTGWSEDDITFMSAALAYYTTFSLAPLIVICIYIAGLFFGKEMVANIFVEQINNAIGSGSADQVRTMIIKFMNPETSIINQIIGIIVLIFGASGVFGALQTGLNAVWHVKLRSDRGIMGIIKDRFLSFTMVLGVSFLLLVSLIITVIITAASGYVNSYFNGGAIVGLVLNFLISTGIITVLFAMMFKYLPDVKIKWADVWLGAFITTLLFTLGKFFLAIYLKYSHTGAEFGAASSLILILVWVFYSAHIFFFGAEFTKAFATRKGHPIRPTKNAVLVTLQK